MKIQRCAPILALLFTTRVEAAGFTTVDRGVVLSNITDGFAGKAPDLGALEVGQAPPHYGPRR